MTVNRFAGTNDRQRSGRRMASAITIGESRKATKTKKQVWEDAPLNLYPLRGFIAYNEIELAVEKNGYWTF